MARCQQFAILHRHRVPFVIFEGHVLRRWLWIHSFQVRPHRRRPRGRHLSGSSRGKEPICSSKGKALVCDIREGTLQSCSSKGKESICDNMERIQGPCSSHGNEPICDK